MMRAERLSLAAAVTITSIVEVRFTVPDQTLSPSDFSAGMPSPVTMDWSSAVAPLTILPSSGTRSPGPTRTTAPAPTSDEGTLRQLWPSLTSAVSGAALIRSRMERRAFVIESCSIDSEIWKSTITMAASGQAPMSTPPTTATAIRAFMLRLR